MPETVRRFTTWTTVLDATDRLPEGRARATLAAKSLWSRLKSPVQSVHITVPGRGNLVARTATFDEERVVVEYDAAGEIIGLELLACVPMSRTPQLRRELRRKGHPLLLCACFYTAHHLWHDLSLALRVASEVGGKGPPPGALRRANPESTAWQEDPRAEPLACGA